MMNNAEEIRDLLLRHFVGGGLDSIDIYDNVVDSGSSLRLLESIDQRLPVKFKTVNGNFDCYGCTLTTLDGCPFSVFGSFTCQNNEIENLIGGPSHVMFRYNCRENRKLTSLEGLPKEVSIFEITWNKSLAMLRLMTMNNGAQIYSSTFRHNIGDIYLDTFNKKIGMGLKAAIWKFQKDLIANGYEGNAKW
jgi:hypothetical protein